MPRRPLFCWNMLWRLVDLIAMVLLVDLGDDRVLIVASHIVGNALGDKEGGNAFHRFHLIPLVVGIKVDLGAVVQIYVIFQATMIVVGLNTDYLGIGEMLLDKGGDGFGQSLDCSGGSSLSLGRILSHCRIGRSGLYRLLLGRHGDLLLLVSVIIVTAAGPERKQRYANRQYFEIHLAHMFWF